MAIITSCSSNTMETKSRQLVPDHDAKPNIAQLQPVQPPVVESDRTIRIGILLDTSNSMDGLIDQAKAQLWSIVSTLSKATDQGETPRFEVALYEYGNSGLSASTGHIRQVSAFTTDLDMISMHLFALRTNGGDEYCGQVIGTALAELDWSSLDDDLQLLVIAGNEPFTQGSHPYSVACKRAATQGLNVNTIFCGNYDEGVATDWKNGATTGNGHYANIDHNQALIHIETPYDAELAALNTKLNGTYLAYGSKGAWYKSNQMVQDGNARTMNESIYLERTVAKSSSYYDNYAWDLVDAMATEDFDLDKVSEKELPEAMQGMTKTEREEYVEAKKKERAAIQEQIGQLAAKREAFLQKHREENGQTLGDVLIELIRKQAEAKGFTFDA